MRKNGRKIKKENSDNFLKESFRTITRREFSKQYERKEFLHQYEGREDPPSRITCLYDN